MSRRPGAGAAVDRHALLSGGYPSSSRNSPRPYGGPNRAPSPYEQPYVNGSTSSGYAQTSSTPYPASSIHLGMGGGGGDEDYSEYDKKGAASSSANLIPGASGLMGRFAAYGSQRSAQDLEEQNDERLEGLSAKVRVLKDITLGIGNEVRESTAELGSLGELFTNSSALLSNTFGRMNRMAKRQGGWWCNMMLFLLFVCWIFVILWWWRR